ncbi:MAG: hypothetical protein WC683_01225 [bacterium]
MRDQRSAIDAALVLDGLPGFNVKLEIGVQDVYAKVAFYGERLVHLDVTVSAQGGQDEIMTTARDATNAATKTDDARAMVEMLCRQANTLLQSGAWDEEALIEAWLGTRFEPDGWCTFPAYGQERRTLHVSSPLDAVAKLIQVRLAGWRRIVQMRTRVRGKVTNDVVDAGGDRGGGADDRRPDRALVADADDPPVAAERGGDGVDERPVDGSAGGAGAGAPEGAVR